MGMCNFMLNWEEHEKKFDNLTSDQFFAICIKKKQATVFLWLDSPKYCTVLAYLVILFGLISKHIFMEYHQNVYQVGSRLGAWSGPNTFAKDVSRR